MTTSPKHAAEQDVRRPPAATRDPQETPDMSLELVNVARAMFGLLLPQPDAPAFPSPSQPASPEQASPEQASREQASSVPASVPVPSVPVPSVAVASVPVPDLPASPVPGPEIRPSVPRSMAMLSEVGFLDD